jgi:hypothetical protein
LPPNVGSAPQTRFPLRRTSDRLRRLILASPVILAALLWPWQVTDYPNHSGDTAEYQFVGHVHGIPHPPGSPVYVTSLWLLGRALPFATPALVANGLTLLCGLGLLAITIRLMTRWGLAPAAVTLGGLMLGAAPLMSRLATVAEIYVPGLFLLVLALDRLEAWRASGHRLPLLAAAVAAALATGVYAGTVIMLPALAVPVWASRRPILRNRAMWLALLVGGALVAAVYLAQIPRLLDPGTPYRWTWVEDTQDVVRYLTGGGFREHFTLTPAQESLGRRTALYAEKLLRETIWLPAVLALALLVVRRRRIWCRGDLAPAVLLLGNLVFIVTYDVWDVWDFQLPGLLATALLSARALDALLRAGGTTGWRRGWGRGTAGILIAACLVHVAVTQDEVRARVREPKFSRTAQARLAASGEGAVVFCSFWDDSAFLWYHLYKPDAPRRDVMLANAQPAAVAIRYLREDRAFVLANDGRTVTPGRPVHVVGSELAAELERAGFASRAIAENMFLIERPGAVPR